MLSNETTTLYGGNRRLTVKEQTITALVAEGYKNKRIGTIIGTTEQVVKNHIRDIFNKTGMGDRLELALWYETHKHELADTVKETV